MIPPKLKIGNQIRIISTPAMGEISREEMEKAVTSLESIGLNLSFNNLPSKSATSYIDEINEAFIDPEVHGLILASGIDDDIDFSRIDHVAISAHPKVICGLAEASVLAVYLYNKTGLINYFGPNLKMLGQSSSLDQCVAAMKEMLMINASLRVFPSTYYGTGQYQTRKSEIWVINDGMAEGRCMIGSKCINELHSLHLGSSLDFHNNIIILCGNHIQDISDLEDNLEMLLGIKGGDNIGGLIIGGIEDQGIRLKQVKDLIHKKNSFSHIPVLANVNLIKSDPKFTIPVGGGIRMKIKGKNQVKIDIISH